MSIGGSLSEARHREGLTVADVSARTRIREGLIRAIEQDEFGSCGGDFYARGHIRAIAAAVGTDPRPLISEYDTAHLPGGPAAGLPASQQPASPATREDLRWEPPRRPRRRRGGWLVPIAMLVCLALIGYVAIRLTSGPGGGSQPSAAAPSRTAARTPVASGSPRSNPRFGTASKPASPARTAVPLIKITPVSAVAFGPSGTSDGDNPQTASLALSGDPATPWHTDWYATARFGNVQAGTGLLLDLGRTVRAASVSIQLGSTPGADLQLRAGTAVADLHVVASAANAGGALRLPLASHPYIRYVLIWFTLLPPDAAGTYQADVSSVTVTGSAA
ncbi:helix-turn-helix domain-containing protein [Trebonia sp.]|uniref:helix-turn-helix domain-containing protein n=1 Tax=Trebonia sp. TaxID=2767075 RepID=UPI002630B4F3|nr:helix-turn-helix domain-containing protein [Trebonia sp.]